MHGRNLLNSNFYFSHNKFATVYHYALQNVLDVLTWYAFRLVKIGIDKLFCMFNKVPLVSQIL